MSSDVVTRLQLDPTLYALAEDEAAFFKAQTRIEDDIALKHHIYTVQEEACTRIIAFAVSDLQVGNDPRKAVADGYPVEQVITSDLHPEFWELGHKLFKTTAETFPAHFIPQDIFQLKGLTKEGVPSSVPSLSQVQSLADLRGSISVIHTSAFFHLFDEEGQFELAKIMAVLLSSEPGSMIFGVHGGRLEKGIREAGSNSGRRRDMFCHSPESWRALWDGEIYPKGSVRVDAFLHTNERDRLDTVDSGIKSYHLVWCVTLL
ncbi:hypothetical protein IW261DRAFT_1563464 [Armillaria novae-zelandiae]|uniref:Uncharacterized protein n=1 Tax=Armillaria novae-zelandiae TaxID=153914 RepID=A0AA39PBJ3_9AGAR|nr:hypothetical protein IW261DRAFT_1563464 [Armillaria novae-zelandiae]